ASRPAGAAIVPAPHGAPPPSPGAPSARILPRTSLAPLQAIASVPARATLSGERLAIATASHDGTARHAELVRSMLAEVGLTEDALRCPPAWPSNTEARRALMVDHAEKSPLHHNCSGKHAAMLTACRANGWDIETYLHPDHPL